MEIDQGLAELDYTNVWSQRPLSASGILLPKRHWRRGAQHGQRLVQQPGRPAAMADVELSLPGYGVRVGVQLESDSMAIT